MRHVPQLADASRVHSGPSAAAAAIWRPFHALMTNDHARTTKQRYTTCAVLTDVASRRRTRNANAPVHMGVSYAAGPRCAKLFAESDINTVPARRSTPILGVYVETLWLTRHAAKPHRAARSRGPNDASALETHARTNVNSQSALY